MGVSENGGTPKSSILIGFSIIFTIHFGGFPPIFGSTPFINGPLVKVARGVFPPQETTWKIFSG